MNLRLPMKQTDIGELTSVTYKGVRPDINTGDFLFCSGTQPLSRIIQTVTGSPYSHVALVVRMWTILPLDIAAHQDVSLVCRIS